MRDEIVLRKGEMLAGGGVGTPGGLQHLMFVMGGTIAFVAEEPVLEGMFVSDVRSGSRFELGELVG